MASCSKIHTVLLLFLFLLLILFTQGAAADFAMRRAAAQQSVLVSRRRLNSFRICAVCTCCGGPKGLCLPSPCCYAINCNIPNRPFGFCAFTPKTCNCFGCHLY